MIITIIFFNGIQKDDIKLQRDDVVFIPVKGKSVQVLKKLVDQVSTSSKRMKN